MRFCAVISPALTRSPCSQSYAGRRSDELTNSWCGRRDETPRDVVAVTDKRKGASLIDLRPTWLHIQDMLATCVSVANSQPESDAP